MVALETNHHKHAIVGKRRLKKLEPRLLFHLRFHLLKQVVRLLYLALQVFDYLLPAVQLLLQHLNEYLPSLMLPEFVAFLKH